MIMPKKAIGKEQKIERLEGRIENLQDDQRSFYIFAHKKGNDKAFWMKQADRTRNLIAKLETQIRNHNVQC